MAIRKVEHVNLPYAGRRTSPDNSRLSALYTRGGEVLADIALRKGENAARMYGQLAGLFTNYQETGRQKQATAAATALRATEREQDRLERERDRQAERDMRKEAQRLVTVAKAEAEAKDLVMDTPVGPLSDTDPRTAMLQKAIAQFPALAGRFSTTERLPATPLAGEMVDSPPLLTRTPTGVEQRQMATDAATQAERVAAGTRATRDDVRADRALDLADADRDAMRVITKQNADIAQQNALTAAANAKARLGTGAGTLTPAYRNALERVIGNVPANRRGSKIAHAERLLSEENEPELKDFIRQNAIDTENVDTKNQVLGRMATVASLVDTKAILREMKAKGVPTNILTGTLEDVARKLGTSTNPEYASLANRLSGTLINYRRAATGVAFGEREAAQYEKMFPNYKNTLPVNEALIDGLLREMTTYDRVYWEHKLGKDGADLILGPLPGAPPPGAPKDAVDALIEKYRPKGGG